MNALKSFSITTILLFAACANPTTHSHKLPAGEDNTIAYADPDNIDPALPNVLIIGDSISVGYTFKVRDSLKGVANVYRVNENCQSTRYALQRLDSWLAGRHFDVIHFNFGLWDLAHKRYDQPELDVPGKGPPSDSDNGFITASPWQYQANLKVLVSRLKATGAKLIFATTTPIPPEGSGGRFAHSEEFYNQFALEVMNKESILIDDLYTQFLPVSENYRLLPGNVHFNEAGYDILAGFVTSSIQGVIKYVHATMP